MMFFARLTQSSNESPEWWWLHALLPLTKTSFFWTRCFHLHVSCKFYLSPKEVVFCGVITFLVLPIGKCFVHGITARVAKEVQQLKTIKITITTTYTLHGFPLKWGVNSRPHLCPVLLLHTERVIRFMTGGNKIMDINKAKHEVEIALQLLHGYYTISIII